MRTIALTLSCALLLLSAPARANLTTRQMKTTGTPTQVPAAAASNGSSDSVARVDHEHPCAAATSSQAGCLQPADFQFFHAKMDGLTCTTGYFLRSNGTGWECSSQWPLSQLEDSPTANLCLKSGGTLGDPSYEACLPGAGACTAGQYTTAVSGTGAPTCSQVQTSEIGGTWPIASLSDSATANKCILSGGAAGDPAWGECTATALRADPTDCSGNEWARGINASGAAQCAQPGFSNLSGQLGLTQIPACSTDQVILYDGSAWVCASKYVYVATHGIFEWPPGTVGCTTDCDSSSGQPCCLTSWYDGTTGGQVIPGTKKWSGDAWHGVIKGYLNLRLYTEDGTLTLEPKYDRVVRLANADSIRASTTTSYELGLEVPTPSTATASRVVVRNGGGLETTWRTDFDVQAGDIDIESGDLRLAGIIRIERDGDATFASVSASSGSLPASAITSGTLGVARGGTGLSSATGDAVMVGSGSAWEAKVIPDCDATGGRLQYDQSTNAFSCATRSSWTTVSSFTNSWAACATAPRYLIDADGRVNLSGCIASGTAGSAAFTLPSGYRPAASRGFAVATGVGADATCFLLVATDGTVTPRTACSNAAVYLDGVSFFTD